MRELLPSPASGLEASRFRGVKDLKTYGHMGNAEPHSMDGVYLQGQENVGPNLPIYGAIGDGVTLLRKCSVTMVISLPEWMATNMSKLFAYEVSDLKPSWACGFCGVFNHY